MSYDVDDRLDQADVPALDRPGGDAARRGATAEAHLVDVTMLYAPRSGGVKRYLTAKRAWFAAERPGVDHTLLVPAERSGGRPGATVTLSAPKIPLADGYRWPTNLRKWSQAIETLRPNLIEAADPYTPGQAALDAGQALGVPVIGFCHSDPAWLAALHLGEWAMKPVEKRWARLFGRFDRVIAPSRFIADRLAGAGVTGVVHQPLGVDVDAFRPERADRPWLLKKLGLGADARLLVFAGRPAKEKNIEVLIDAVQRLGDPYHLLLVGAGAGLPAEDRVIAWPFERDPKALARVIGSCDAFVHANDREPFGLIVLEAMACGAPVVGVRSGGVAETVHDGVGRLAPRAEAGVFAEAVEDLFRQDLAALGAAARAHAAEQFAWDRVFSNLAAVYAQTSGRAVFAKAQAPALVH